MKTNILILLAISTLILSCNDKPNNRADKHAEKSAKTQTIEEAFATVHNAPTTGILSKLENKIKTVKKGDSRKAIVAKFDGEGLTQNLGSLSSDNQVEIRSKGNKRQLSLVTKSSFKERVTRFVLEFDKGDTETGTFEIGGMSLFIETYKKDGASYEITSAESWVKGTVELHQNDDNTLKGTAQLTIPKLNFNKNGSKESTSEDVKIDLGFFNANL